MRRERTAIEAIHFSRRLRRPGAALARPTGPVRSRATREAPDDAWGGRGETDL